MEATKRKWLTSAMVAILGALLAICCINMTAYAEDGDLTAQSAPSVSYQTHVENIGWQGWKSDGAMSGTQGKALRLEAIKMTLSDDSGGIEYKAHVENIGWQGWKSDGAMSGTQGKALRLEAIQIKLTGSIADSYDVYYRVHAQNIGWMGWAKDGESAGTAGYSYRLEAIQVVLVPKGSAAPTSVSGISSVTSTPFADANGVKSAITYDSTLHIQNIGTRSYNDNDGTTMEGTSGHALRLEYFTLKLNNTTGYSGGIEYKAHVENIGWQGWKSDGAVAGTHGKSLRMEALKIKLTGDLADHYDVYYRAHVQDIGWQGWKQNGEEAGTDGQSKRIEAIYVTIVPKGSPAPTASNGVADNTGGSTTPTNPTTPTDPNKTYTVKFVSGTGTTYSSTTYHYGDTPVAPTFSMTGMKRDFNANKVAVDSSLAAGVTKASMGITCSADGSGTYTWSYSTPQRDDSTATYAFAGWDKSISAVTGDATYTARWKTIRQHDGSAFPTQSQISTTAKANGYLTTVADSAWSSEKRYLRDTIVAVGADSSGSTNASLLTNRGNFGTWYSDSTHKSTITTYVVGNDVFYITDGYAN